MRVLTFFFTTSCFCSSLIAQDAGLLARVDTLEQRVAKLESMLQQPGAAKAAVAATSGKVLFQDDFEKGLANWTTEEAKATRWKDANSEIKEFTQWRTAKMVRANGLTIEPASGNRFGTTARQTDGLSVIGCGTSNYSNWQGFRFLIEKKGLDLSQAELPLLTLKLKFEYFRTNDNIPNGVQIGYIIEGQSIGQFKPLLKIGQKVDDWTEYEVDLSPIPKEKKVRLAIVYFAPQSRFAASSGLHVDDLVVVDQAG